MSRVLAAIAALLFALSLIAVRSGTETRARAEGDASGFSTMKDVTVTSTEGGRPIWSLRSGSVLLPDEGDLVKIGALELTLHADGVTLTADSGRYDIARDELALSGGVRAGFGDYMLSSGSLVIAPGGGRLWSDGSVVLKGSGIKIFGTGLEALEGKKVRLLGGVKAVFN